MISKLRAVIKNIACAGKFLIASNLFAPRYWDTIDEIALRVWPKTQINMDKKVVTIPTAAKDTVAFFSMLPIIAASVKDNIGSDTPAISAGMASLFICFNVIGGVLKVLIHNSKKEIHFVWGNKFLLIFYNREVRKTFGFSYFEKKYLT